MKKMAMDFTKSKNASSLKKIQEKSIANSNKIVAIDIPLDQIDKNEDNEKIFSMDEIEVIAKSIESEGFFGAIEVYKKPDGRYEISSGHRRYEAMRYLNRSSIPCIVKEIPDDFTRGKKLLASNIYNRKLTPLEMAKSIDFYHELITQNNIKGDFKKMAAEFFQISESQIYRYQCLTKLIPELQNIANDPEISFSAFRNAVVLSEEGQKELYKQIMYVINNGSEDKDLKLTRPKIEQMVNNIRSKEEFSKKPPRAKKQEGIKESEIPVNTSVLDESTLNQFGIKPLNQVFKDTENTVEEENKGQPQAQLLINTEGNEQEERKQKEYRIQLVKAVNILANVANKRTTPEDIKDIQECVTILQSVVDSLKKEENI